jgi:hypothetical protein
LAAFFFTSEILPKREIEKLKMKWFIRVWISVNWKIE